MSDLLIKGMDMPKNGLVTIELASEETGTNILARITDDKTGKLIEYKGVVEIPTPHGRLIDADRLEDRIKNMVGKYDTAIPLYVVYRLIADAHPIIEAEE